MNKIKFRQWDALNRKMTELKNLKLPWEQMRDGIHIMQFTGLLDHHRKEIYEGDIMKYENYKGEVYFEDVNWCLIEDSCVDCGLASGFYIKQPSGGEVVGNIYENPELLNDKREFKTEKLRKTSTGCGVEVIS
jgi:uncharacterized phage protein (TIGR01671 family)